MWHVKGREGDCGTHVATFVCILDQEMLLVTLEEIHSCTAAANIYFVTVKKNNNEIWDV